MGLSTFRIHLKARTLINQVADVKEPAASSVKGHGGGSWETGTNIAGPLWNMHYCYTPHFGLQNLPPYFLESTEVELRTL